MPVFSGSKQAGWTLLLCAGLGAWGLLFILSRLRVASGVLELTGAGLAKAAPDTGKVSMRRELPSRDL